MQPIAVKRDDAKPVADKILVLQNTGMEPANQSQHSSNSKSPLEVANENALTVGQHCYSPHRLSQREATSAKDS